jgi:hypothetical protein
MSLRDSEKCRLHDTLSHLLLKRPGREANRSPPSNVEIKNAWNYISTPSTPSWRGASKVESPQWPGGNGEKRENFSAPAKT